MTNYTDGEDTSITEVLDDIESWTNVDETIIELNRKIQLSKLSISKALNTQFKQMEKVRKAKERSLRILINERARLRKVKELSAPKPFGHSETKKILTFITRPSKSTWQEICCYPSYCKTLLGGCVKNNCPFATKNNWNQTNCHLGSPDRKNMAENFVNTLELIAKLEAAIEPAINKYATKMRILKKSLEQVRNNADDTEE